MLPVFLDLNRRFERDPGKRRSICFTARNSKIRKSVRSDQTAKIPKGQVISRPDTVLGQPLRRNNDRRAPYRPPIVLTCVLLPRRPVRQWSRYRPDRRPVAAKVRARRRRQAQAENQGLHSPMFVSSETSTGSSSTGLIASPQNWHPHAQKAAHLRGGTGNSEIRYT